MQKEWGSCGLVVMGGGSCSRDCGFKSQNHVLDGKFSYLFVVICSKKTNNQQKDTENGPFKNLRKGLELTTSQDHLFTSIFTSQGLPF